MPKPLLLLLVPLAGCATGLQLPPLSPSHPASPEAVEGSMPVLRTLALPSPGESGEAPTTDEPAPSAPRMPSSHEEHGGGHGHAH